MATEYLTIERDNDDTFYLEKHVVFDVYDWREGGYHEESENYIISSGFATFEGAVREAQSLGWPASEFVAA